MTKQLPKYSLLEKHEPELEYFIIDPLDESRGYIKVELASFELEDWDDVEEGIQMKMIFKGPTRFHKQPEWVCDYVETYFNLLSRGYSDGGKTYRIQGHTPAEIREVAKDIAFQTFVHWYTLEEYTDWIPGEDRNETHSERKERLTPEKDIQDTGIVLLKNGDEFKTPYSREEIEMKHSEDVESPTDKIEQTVQDVINELIEKHPPHIVAEGLGSVDVDVTPATKTNEKKQKLELEKKLRNIHGIGTRRLVSIANEFTTIDEIKEDIENGSERLSQINNIPDNVSRRIEKELLNN